MRAMYFHRFLLRREIIYCVNKRTGRKRRRKEGRKPENRKRERERDR